MTARDPRLTDDRVKAARSAEWFRGMVADDPNPEYSNLDQMGGLSMVDDSRNPPARPVRAVPLAHIGEPVIQSDPHGYIQIGKTIAWLGLIVIVVGLAFTLGWLTHLTVVTR